MKCTWDIKVLLKIRSLRRALASSFLGSGGVVRNPASRGLGSRGISE